MTFKAKRCYLAVFLLYTVAAASCKPSVDPTPPAPQDRERLLPSARGPYRSATRGGRRRIRLDLPPGGRSRGLGDASGDRSGQIRGSAVTSGTMELVSPGPPSDDCVAGKVESVTPGRVYISGQLDFTLPNVGYQADSTFPGQEKVRGQRPGLSDIWQKLQPVVDCGDSAMTVTFRRRRASQVLLDLANESSVPLSRPPPRCGYSVQTTWRDLRLMAQYDACHVTRKHGSYELPLLWRETPVKVSCPVSHSQAQSNGPLSVCCFPQGLSVNVQGGAAAELLKVNVRGQWTHLIELVEPCGFTLDGQDGELSIAVPFFTCGITLMNGKHTLSIQLGDKKFLLACPESTPEQPRLPPEVVGSPDLPSEAAEHSLESLKHFVWSPPFYLAPPLYPHPTYHKYSHPDSRDPSTSSPTPAPTFGSQSVPPVGSLSEYQDYFLYPDSLNEHVTHDSGSSAADMVSSGQFSDGHQAPLLSVLEQHRVILAPSVTQTRVGSPSLAPPFHTLNQYQHPNIPLPAQYAAPAPVVESPLLASGLHHPDAAGQFNMDQFFHGRPAHNTQAHAAAPNALYPAQPHSDHQWYHFPHGGPKLPPFNPELFINRHASSHQSSGSTLDNNPYWRRYEPLSDNDFESPLLNAGEVSPEQTSFPAGIPSPPFYHPPQHHYQLYYGPELSPSGLTQMSNNPLLRTFRPLSPSPLSEPVHGVQHLPPYRYHQPETSAGDGDVPHEGNINPISDPRLPSDSDHDFTVWLNQLSEAENPSMLQANPSNIYLYDTEAYPDVEAPDELLDNQIEEFYLGQYLAFPVADSMAEPTIPPRSAAFSGINCALQRLTSDPNTYGDECGLNQDVETLGPLMEYPSHQDFGLDFLNAARLGEEYGSPGEVRLRPARSAETSLATRLRIATDQTFTSFYPEAHLPLSLIQGKPVYVEVSLLDPPEPGLVLLVHSCLAFSHTAYPSWMVVYDGCPSRRAAQLLPSPNSHHIQRIMVSSFLSPFSESPASFDKDFPQEDPEILFLCSTGACSPEEGGCIEGCINAASFARTLT
ncbi:uncharacterized protein isoform X1 [Takifugu rubripes]|uniref:uncharacterized protein isoform X1 n=1 Tax=Takifugu rubripes TaxID=31033 RepID=UPI0011454ABC|nr:uncharacterized protein LOC105416396 isoform X1 [Takifugu rubripes]